MTLKNSGLLSRTVAKRPTVLERYLCNTPQRSELDLFFYPTYEKTRGSQLT